MPYPVPWTLAEIDVSPEFGITKGQEAFLFDDSSIFCSTLHENPVSFFEFIVFESLNLQNILAFYTLYSFSVSIVSPVACSLT